MPNNITVNRGDTLVKIVKREYGLTNDTDIMNTVNLIKQKNNLKNINIIKVGQELELPEQLRLNNVTIFGENKPTILKPDNNSTKNYYRATKKDKNNEIRVIFGDTAINKKEYPDQPYSKSLIWEKTIDTKFFIEDVFANICGLFMNKTSRDAKMADVFAKEIGLWTRDGKDIGTWIKEYKDKNPNAFMTLGTALEETDAYKFALKQNIDDYTIHNNKAYFDNSKSDGNITLFGFEKIGGNEYLTMRDSEGKVHYFDKSDNLSEVEM